MSDEETRVATIEKRLRGLEVTVEQARRQLAAWLQEMRDLDQIYLAAPVACTYTVPFSVTGCNGVALPNAVVTLQDIASGSVFTGTTSAGGAVSIVATSTTTSPTYKYFITHPSPRLVSPQPAYSGAFAATCATTHATVGLVFTPAAGYACMTGCVFPVSKTITVTDSVFGGPVTLTWAAGTDWQGATTVNFSACGPHGCVARAGFPVTYQISAAAAARAVYKIDLSTGCPFTAGAQTFDNFGTVIAATCPGSATSDKWSTTLQLSFQRGWLYCNNTSAQLSFTE